MESLFFFRGGWVPGGRLLFADEGEILLFLFHGGCLLGGRLPPDGEESEISLQIQFHITSVEQLYYRIYYTYLIPILSSGRACSLTFDNSL